MHCDIETHTECMHRLATRYPEHFIVSQLTSAYQTSQAFQEIRGLVDPESMTCTVWICRF